MKKLKLIRLIIIIVTIFIFGTIYLFTVADYILSIIYSNWSTTSICKTEEESNQLKKELKKFIVAEKTTDTLTKYELLDNTSTILKVNYSFIIDDGTFSFEYILKDNPSEIKRMDFSANNEPTNLSEYVYRHSSDTRQYIMLPKLGYKILNIMIIIFCIILIIIQIVIIKKNKDKSTTSIK